MTLRVVIGGWYGAANLGDELLLRVIADWVHEAGGRPIANAIGIKAQMSGSML